jgi:hypothetical protein
MKCKLSYLGYGCKLTECLYRTNDKYISKLQYLFIYLFTPNAKTLGRLTKYGEIVVHVDETSLNMAFHLFMIRQCEELLLLIEGEAEIGEEPG